MDGSIRLSEEERKVLLQTCRSGSCVRTARRAQIVLLLAKGWSYRLVREATFASFELIRDCLARFHRGGVDAVLKSPEPGKQPPWWRRVLTWLTKSQPEDFGYYRTRWSCAMLAEVLAWETGLRRSAETVRRALRRLNWVWRRPRPVVGPTDPDYDEKLRQIRDLLADLPAEETAVFQDEVDVHLNPKIGSCWMQRGEQAEVRTPGNNEKRHVAGSLHWRTGSLVVSPPGRCRDFAVVHRSSGTLAPPVARLPDDPHHLRQCRVPSQPGGPGVLGSLGTSFEGSLFAEVRPGDESNRARLVALSRNHHPQPSLPEPD
jgi:transposase